MCDDLFLVCRRRRWRSNRGWGGRHWRWRMRSLSSTRGPFGWRCKLQCPKLFQRIDDLGDRFFVESSQQVESFNRQVLSFQSGDQEALFRVQRKTSQYGVELRRSFENGAGWNPAFDQREFQLGPGRLDQIFRDWNRAERIVFNLG